MSVKLETETIRTIAAFEKMTRVHARDCLIMDECIYFLVEKERIGAAIGKNGSSIKEVSKAFGKQVRLFAYHDNAEDMIKAMVPNIKNLTINKDSITFSVPASDRVAVIGKNGRNIKAIKEIMERHFQIKSVRLR